MAYEEKITDIPGAVTQVPERRKESLEVLMGEYPTEAELAASIMPTVTGEEVGFFSNRGLRFTAGWWMNHYAEELGGDIAKVPDSDIEDRIKGVLKKMNRAEDARLIADEIRAARKWYGAQKASQ